MAQDRMANYADSMPEGGSSSPREYAEELKVKSGESAVLRLLDGSNSFRSCWTSWFMCDDDIIRPFIVENETEGKGVLARMLGDQKNYFNGGFLESKRGQFGKIYTYQGKEPELFKRMTAYWNPSYNGTGTCRPKLDFIFNAIHRNAQYMDDLGREAVWCVEKRHTKIFKVGSKAFKALKLVRDNDGEFVDYDIVFSKTGTGNDTQIAVLKAGINVANVVTGSLSDSEKSYERYDLDQLTKLSSAYYILKNIRGLVERCDVVMGTSYLQELTSQQQIEQELYEKRKASTSEPSPVAAQVPGFTPPTPKPQVAPQPSAAPAPPRSRVPVAGNTATTICGHCKKTIPSGSEACPLCTGPLIVACDICGAKMGYFDEECSGCHTKYQANSNPFDDSAIPM